ncbi:MAG: hypothetical protein E7307_02930 [Butyrivibrio sp.]|nr:hypothetical protein [Butyrivibrio sp.]
MKKVRNGTKRTLALMLSAMLLVGSLPGKAYAAEDVDPTGEQDQIILEEDTEAPGEEASVSDASNEASSETEVIREDQESEKDNPEAEQGENGSEEAGSSQEDKASEGIENSEDGQNPEEIPEVEEDQLSKETTDEEDSAAEASSEEEEKIIEEQEDDSLYGDVIEPIGPSNIKDLWDKGRRQTHRREGNTHKTITGLGTGAITDPQYAKSENDPWRGSYVWYGFEWENTDNIQEEVRYRVLDAKTDRFGGDTMFLDCDTVIGWNSPNTHRFPKGTENPSYSTYPLRAALNDCNNDKEFQFLQEDERWALAPSTIATHKIDDRQPNVEKDGIKAFTDYTPLYEDYVFLLDYEDITNQEYGYNMNIGLNQDKEAQLDRIQGSAEHVYFLRSFTSSEYAQGDYEQGGYRKWGANATPNIAFSSVYVSGSDVISGISPAFNVNRENIVFSSLVSGTAGQVGAEYKLTLVNKNGFSLSASDVRKDGNSYIIPFWITIGEGAYGYEIGPTQVSVVVTDGTWSKKGWSDNAKLLQYTSINNDSFTESGNGEGTFTLDSNIEGEWGKDFHVYILAECINGEKESDLASEPLEIFPHVHTIKVTAEGNELTATCTEEGCSLPGNKISVRICAPEADTYGSEDSFAAELDGDDVSKFFSIVSAHFKDDFNIKYEGRGDTIYAQSTVPPTGVGLYTASLTIGGVKASLDYEIRKKNLKVRAVNKTITYGDNAPSSYTFSCDGFVNDDNESSLKGSVSFECKYQRGDDAGKYAILPKGLTSDNYEIEFCPGTLTVEKANPSVSEPTGRTDLAFTGRGQVLVEQGTTDFGEFWYAVTTSGNAAPEFDYGKKGTWSTSLPTAVDAGNYSVWYLFKGDKNHNDISAKDTRASITSKSLSEEDRVKTIHRRFSINNSHIDSIELSDVLPADCGKIYNVECKFSNDIYLEDPWVSMDKTKVQYLLMPGVTDADTDTIKITVTTQNYEGNFTINCIVSVVSYSLGEKTGNSYSQVKSQNLLVGKSVTLYMTDKDRAPVKGEKLLWSSDNSGVVSVSQTGKITGVSAGKACVTVQRESSDEPEAQCDVIVSDPVTSLTLDMKKYSFGTGEEVRLTASVLPYTASGEIKWSTSDKDAVIICRGLYDEELWYPEDVNGKGRVYYETDEAYVTVRAVGPSKGKVTVTAEAADGSGKKASCTFEVGNPVGDFTITAKSGKNVVSSLQVGKTVNMAVNWADGAPKNKELTWSVVDNEGYDIYRTATVSEKGVLKGISEGTIRVKATSKANPEKYAISDPIVIYVPVKSVALKEKTGTVSLDENSSDARISVDLVAADGSKGTAIPSSNNNLVISGSNATGELLGDDPYLSFDIQEKYKSLIDVTSTGYVFAKKSIPAGTKLPATAYVDVTVHAYNYKKTLSYKVTIKEENPLKGIILPKNVTVGVDNSKDVVASFNPLNPDSTFNPHLIWSISDKDKEIIRFNAYYDETSNEYRLRIGGLKPGTATITVKTKDSFKVGKKDAPFTASCKVTVKPSVSAVSLKNSETLTKNGLAVGKTFKLQPEFTLTGKGSAVSKNLVWKSSNTRLAVVSDKGVITAVDEGNVTITATLEGDSFTFNNGVPSVSVTFDVFNQIKAIKADKTKMTIGTQDSSRYGQISIAAVTPYYATYPAVKWSVDKNNTGVLLGVIRGDKTARNADYAANPGESVITRKDEFLAVMGITPGVVKITGVTTDGSNKKVSCTVTVRGQVTRLKLKEKISNSEYNSIRLTNSPSDKVLKYESFMKTNTSISVTTDLEINGVSSSDKLFSSYKKYTDTGLVFRSSNTKVATVDSKGKIKIQKKPNDADVTIYISTIDGRQTAELYIDVDDRSGK